MISANSEVSNCLYLFEKKEEEIFNTQKFSPDFIDKCLDTLMRVHLYLLQEKEAFFLIDSIAYNDQCHLYALRTAQICRKFKKGDMEKRSSDNRFFHLSFFISFTFLLDNSLYEQTVLKTAKQKGFECPTPAKQFSLFCKDTDGQRTREARRAYNKIFQLYLLDSIEEIKTLSQLGSELSSLFTQEHLTLNRKGENYYTPPKLASVAYMLEIFEKESFSYALKIKVMNKEGSGVVTYCDKKPEQDDPVIVFEGFASTSFSIEECGKIAEKCPAYHRRHPSSKERHKEGETCLFCQSNKIDVTPFESRIKIAVRHRKMMFYTLGADFIKEAQPFFLPIFQNKEKYPELSQLFEKATQQIEPLGLSMQHPITFSISFVFADTASHALNEEMMMDFSPRKKLESRGIL